MKAHHKKYYKVVGDMEVSDFTTVRYERETWTEFIWFDMYPEAIDRFMPHYLPIFDWHQDRIDVRMVFALFWPLARAWRWKHDLWVSMAVWCREKGWLEIPREAWGTVFWWPKYLKPFNAIHKTFRALAYNECECGGRLIPYGSSRDICDHCQKETP